MKQRSRFFRSAPTAVVVLAVAIVLAMTAATGAVAAKLITGKQIARDTITAKNLAPKSVGKSELQPGLLKAGPKGATGERGPVGPGGPSEVFTWTTSFTADGTAKYDMYGGNLPVAVSTQTLPRFSRIEVRSVDVSDDFRGCRGASVFAVPTGVDYQGDPYSNAVMFTASQLQGYDPVNVTTGSQAIFTQASDWHLSLYAECKGASFQRIAVPSFSATVVFAATQLPGTSTNSFK